VIATPLRGRLRLAGTMQLTGFDRSIDRVRVDAVWRAGIRNLVGLSDRRVVDVWSGFRPCPPDGLPIIGRAPGWDNVIVATGHAMKGVALAPVTGRIIAELVTGAPPTHDTRPFDPARFVDARRVLFG
jgi:D-amino-acid dehydrogenase